MSTLTGYLLNSFLEKVKRSIQLQACAIDPTLHSPSRSSKLGLTTYIQERKYHTGEATIHNGSLMLAITDTTGAFNPAHWQKAFALGSVIYCGQWNAAKNEPPLSTSEGCKGEYYIVSESGSTDLNGINIWKAGDWAVHNDSTWERVINEDNKHQE